MTFAATFSVAAALAKGRTVHAGGAIAVGTRLMRRTKDGWHDRAYPDFFEVAHRLVQWVGPVRALEAVRPRSFQWA